MELVHLWRPGQGRDKLELSECEWPIEDNPAAMPLAGSRNLTRQPWATSPVLLAGEVYRLQVRSKCDNEQ